MDSLHTHHTEEDEGPMKTDQADRQSLRDTLDVCLDPLDYTSHPDGAPMNIVTGLIAHPDTNVDNAVRPGHRTIENFKGGRPDSLYCPLGKLIDGSTARRCIAIVTNERRASYVIPLNSS